MPAIKPFRALVVEQILDPTMKLLLISACVSLVVNIFVGTSQALIESISIFIAAALIISLAAGNDLVKEKQFLKLYEELRRQECSVIRG